MAEAVEKMRRAINEADYDREYFTVRAVENVEYPEVVDVCVDSVLRDEDGRWHTGHTALYAKHVLEGPDEQLRDIVEDLTRDLAEQISEPIRR